MKPDDIQSKLRAIIYSIFAVIIGIIVIRVFLKLVGAIESNAFAMFWYDFSNVFVKPWQEIYRPITLGSRGLIEIYSIISLFFYLLFALVTTKSATSLFGDTRKQVIMEITDSIFKILEFLLITRFIFKLTAASTSASFVRGIYQLSDVVYQPFEGILPAIEILGAVIEISTIAAIVIIIILDIVTEQFVFNILNSVFPDQPKKKVSIHAQQGIPQQPFAYNPNPNVPNININLPNQQQPPVYVDRRSVSVNQNPGQPQQRGYLQQQGRVQAPRQGGPAET